jgi:ATP-binding cassette subfamily B protein/subfamily B ATP-binding cassette protein MsbA
MKNSIRALKFAWPYRFRLILSVVFAALAAVFWSLNLTAIYPVLKILGSEQNLQQWVDTEIERTQKDINQLQTQVDALSVRLEKTTSDREKRNITLDLAKLEAKLEPARKYVYRMHVAKRYVDMLFPTDRFQTLALVIGLVVVGIGLKGLFDFGQDYLVGSVVGLSQYDLRNRFYRNVIHLDVNYFSQSGTHELMARFTNDMEMLATGQKTLFGKMIAEPLRALGCIIIACCISWQLTLMFLVLVPVALLILTRVGRTMKRATRRLLERMSNIYKLLLESFRGIRVVKGFTMEPYERRRFAGATKDYYRRAMWVVTVDSLSGPVIELLGTIAIAAALMVGAYLVLNRQTHLWPFGIRMLEQPMDPETLLQLYVALAMVADPVRKLSNVYTRLQSGAAAADRIFSYYDLQPRVRPNADGPRLPRHDRAIEFRDVCFSYENPKLPTLTNINLTIRHGETIALVGRNGSGKSTLVGLLPRFNDPDHGAILIDGIDIREATLRSLRNQIGIVTQDTILFDDSFYNNIAYGDRRASPEEIENAAKQAFIHDFIVQQPEGYETHVGEAAGKLSGGQAQRIALARAILRNPAILILDEFTSQTDTVSESDIHRVLRDFMRGRTTFVITHRLNTLEIADRIVVLEKGRIEAVGTHKELLAGCQVYQILHDSQLRKAA